MLVLKFIMFIFRSLSLREVGKIYQKTGKEKRFLGGHISATKNNIFRVKKSKSGFICFFYLADFCFLE